MHLGAETFAVILILFASTFVRASFGFGDALLAMPLLTLVLGLRQATPLVALVAWTIAALILIRRWRAVRLRSAWRLIVASAAGIPLGLLFLKGVHEEIMSSVLGGVIVLYALFSLMGARRGRLTSDAWAYPFGFLAGILGGAYNTNGPPVVIFAALRRWEPDSFRATLQGYFLTTGLLILIGHASAGLWSRPILKLYGLMLPVVGITVWSGEQAGRKIPRGKFNTGIYLLLAGSGLLLILRAVREMLV